MRLSDNQHVNFGREGGQLHLTDDQTTKRRDKTNPSKTVTKKNGASEIQNEKKKILRINERSRETES